MKVPVPRREELLEQIVDVLLKEGLSELSLRPLAKSVGTSARLLIYHFGSKEELLTDALECVRRRIDASVLKLAEKEQPASLAKFLLLFWNWALEKQNQRYFLLLFQVNGLAAYQRDRFPPHFSGAGIKHWVQAFEKRFDRLSDKGNATLLIAALNGLIHDLLATGDRKRTTEALHTLIRALAPTASPPATAALYRRSTP